MQYAIVDNKKVEAFPKGRGSCPICNASMIAKCGKRNIDHWAHDKRENCDPWWENETEWHRKWKNLFPVECREVTHIADDGEVHRADIKTRTNIIIEVQHSNITDEERISREKFYKNLIWIIDGKPFKDNFDIYHMLPNPKSEIANDIIWFKARRHRNGSNRGMFFRISEAREDYPLIQKHQFSSGFLLVTPHSIDEIEKEINENYNGFHQYDWIRPRKTWLEAKCPVYIDFDDEYLYQLRTYDESDLKCIRLISKRKFIHDVTVETDVHQIATRFYKINKDF